MIYDRQRELNLRIPAHVLIVGCGGVGSWAAIFLTMAGVDRLDLFDPDTVQEHNLNRVPFAADDINKPKVFALHALLIRLRPSARVYAYPLEAHPSTVAELRPDVIVDCSDSVKSQIAISDACKKAGVQYVRCGYNGGDHLTVAGTVPRWNSSDDTRYEVVPSWVIAAVLPAALAVARIMLVKELEFSGRIKDLGGLYV